MHDDTRRSLTAGAELLDSDKDINDVVRNMMADDIRKVLAEDARGARLGYHPGRIANVDHASREEHDQNVLSVRVPKDIIVICEEIEWRMKGSDI